MSRETKIREKMTREEKRWEKYSI